VSGKGNGCRKSDWEGMGVETVTSGKEGIMLNLVTEGLGCGNSNWEMNRTVEPVT
jgi:hypothetical protein